MIYRARLPSSLWDRVWDWHNKLRARIVLRTPAQNYFVSCPTSNLPPFLYYETCVCYTHTVDGDILWRLKHRQLRGKRRRRKYISVKICEFGVKIRNLSGNGSTKETKLDYKPVASPLSNFI